MSRVIDGEDILYKSSYTAGAMSQSLSDLLDGKDAKIPAGVLNSAKGLFSYCMAYLKERNAGSAELKSMITYQLLRDMLRKFEGSSRNVDSDLESLAVAVEALTPDGKQIKISTERYGMMRDLFKMIAWESRRYDARPGNRSPYCIGTFDDDG